MMEGIPTAVIEQAARTAANKHRDDLLGNREILAAIEAEIREIYLLADDYLTASSIALEAFRAAL